MPLTNLVNCQEINNSTVKKRNGTFDSFNLDKILSGIDKSAQRSANFFRSLTNEEKSEFTEALYNSFHVANLPIKDETKGTSIIETRMIEKCISTVLGEMFPDIQVTYDSYNNWKSKYADAFCKVYSEIETMLLRGDRNNANTNSSYVSTKRCLGYNILNKELYQMNFMTPEELKECRIGNIYVHDMVARNDSFNCFSRDTRFITSEGVKSFYDFMPGDKIMVLTHKGNWKPAVVKSYGRQQLQKITFKRGKCIKDVYATPNHRWILNDESETTNIQVGDTLISAPNIAEYDWDLLSREDKKLWCLGFALADGSVCDNNNMPTVYVRLCGHKNEYSYRFEEAGYNVTYPECFLGDGRVILADIHSKDFPLYKINYKNCKYFIDGYLCADGALNKKETRHAKFKSVQSTGYNNIFLYDLLNMSGQYVSSIKDLSGQITNYGQRSGQTYSYRINSNHKKQWKVCSIEEPKSINAHAQVWCLEVEDDHSFILEGGIPTGNCCLCDMKEILTNGFEMGDMDYTEASSLAVAFNVILAVIKSAAAQQYGGFTVPQIDKILGEYAQKSYDEYAKEYIEFAPHSAQIKEIAVKAHEYAMAKVRRDYEQGFQAMEYDLNTIGSSRGDYPFVTITFGLGKSQFERMATESVLKVRKNGQGRPGFKKIVLFPKLVFLYDKNLHGEGKELEYLFDAAIECSSKAMYPDYLSLTGDSYVSEIYKKYGEVISPMGCRAFLSAWYRRGGMYPADENDTPVFVGRANIGVVSLNLPMILQKSRKEERDFYEVLDYYLEMIRGIHKRTKAYLGKLKASCNPLMFCQGGLWGGHLKPDECIAPVIKSWTASFGITALHETQMLYNGKSLTEDSSFVYEVMKHINSKVEEFKAEDDILYAIYGTPAESLCSTQVNQFRKEYGYIKGVSDKDYFTNSFHCAVFEDITGPEKQDYEKKFWDLFNGGKIQYVRYPVDYNLGAIKSIVTRAMDMGFYEGVNLAKCYCEDCGYEQLEMDVCPKCGSQNLTKIDRVSGYLGYTQVKGDTRMNHGKLAEIADRKSM